MASPPAFSDFDFQQALLRLLPRGRIWRRDPASNLSALMGGLAPTYTRNTQAAAQLLLDASPATTLNLLTEWEESLGLPDACTPANPTIAQRQAAVLAKWSGRGGMAVGDYIRVAALLGYAITVTEFTPFSADMPCDGPDYDPAWAFVWQINAPSITIDYFSADISFADDPLETWDSGELVCRLSKLAPAHTELIFDFSGIAGLPAEEAIWDVGRWDIDSWGP